MGQSVRWFAGVALASVLVLSACTAGGPGGTDLGSPEAAVKTYLDALKGHNYEALAAATHPNNRETVLGLTDAEKEAIDASVPFEAAEISNVSAGDSVAKVDVTFRINGEEENAEIDVELGGPEGDQWGVKAELPGIGLIEEWYRLGMTATVNDVVFEAATRITVLPMSTNHVVLTFPDTVPIEPFEETVVTERPGATGFIVTLPPQQITDPDSLAAIQALMDEELQPCFEGSIDCIYRSSDEPENSYSDAAAELGEQAPRAFVQNFESPTVVSAVVDPAMSTTSSGTDLEGLPVVITTDGGSIDTLIIESRGGFVGRKDVTGFTWTTVSPLESSFTAVLLENGNVVPYPTQ